MNSNLRNNKIEFEVYGDYAMFTDPVTRVGGEKFSYQVPTYEALKGITNSIYWKPSIIWIIDQVRVMNPIQTETRGIRTLCNNGKSDLSYYTYLRDCRYQIRAHYIWNKNRPERKIDWIQEKHTSIANRSLEAGGRRDIFLGTRECQGYVEPCKFGEGKGFYDEISEVSFGRMVHGITYADEAYSDIVPETRGHICVRHWRPVMKNGVINFLCPWECDHKVIREMEMKVFTIREEDPEEGVI